MRGGGESDPGFGRTSNRYIHLAPGALRTAIDLLDSLQANRKDSRKTA